MSSPLPAMVAGIAVSVVVTYYVTKTINKCKPALAQASTCSKCENITATHLRGQYTGAMVNKNANVQVMGSVTAHPDATMTVVLNAVKVGPLSIMKRPLSWGPLRYTIDEECRGTVILDDDSSKYLSNVSINFLPGADEVQCEADFSYSNITSNITGTLYLKPKEKEEDEDDDDNDDDDDTPEIEIEQKGKEKYAGPKVLSPDSLGGGVMGGIVPVNGVDTRVIQAIGKKNAYQENQRRRALGGKFKY